MAEETTPEGEAEPKKKKKTLILIIVAANVVLVGAAVPFVLMGGDEAPPAPAKAEGEHAEKGDHGKEGEHGEDKEAEPASAKGGVAKGPLIEFHPIVVNLNEPEGARYLKIQLHVQLASSKMTDEVNDSKPIVRDAFIRELSDLNFRQTMGNKAKLAIKRRLLKKFNQSLGTDAGVEVHITQFVVQ